MGVSKYRDAYPAQAEKLCLLGATDKDMGDFFGVCTDTIAEWRKEYPPFEAACIRGKMEADSKVADRLYARAMGYSHPAVKIFMPAGAAKPVYAPYTQHYPPDTQAATFWLSNRQKGKWQQRVEHTGHDGGPVAVTVVSYAKKVAEEPPKT